MQMVHLITQFPLRRYTCSDAGMTWQPQSSSPYCSAVFHKHAGLGILFYFLWHVTFFTLAVQYKAMVYREANPCSLDPGLELRSSKVPEWGCDLVSCFTYVFIQKEEFKYKKLASQEEQRTVTQKKTWIYGFKRANLILAMDKHIFVVLQVPQPFEAPKKGSGMMCRQKLKGLSPTPPLLSGSGEGKRGGCQHQREGRKRVGEGERNRTYLWAAEGNYKRIKQRHSAGQKTVG